MCSVIWNMKIHQAERSLWFRFFYLHEVIYSYSGDPALHSRQKTDKVSRNFLSVIYAQTVWFYRFRSSRSQMFFKKDLLKNSSNFPRKILCWSFFLTKAMGLRPVILLEKRLQHRCFPVKFAKLLRTPFFQNTCGDYFWRFTKENQNHTENRVKRLK